MLRLLLTLLLLMPLATQASEGEFFLAAKPAEQASLLEGWAAQPDTATCAKAASPPTTRARCA